MSRIPIEPDFIPWRDVAKRVGVATLKALRGLAVSGDFPHPHVVGRRVVYLRQQVDAWFAELSAGRLAQRRGTNRRRAALANSPYALIDPEARYVPPPSAPLLTPRQRPTGSRPSNRVAARRARSKSENEPARHSQ
jgi:hypothetical protein